jgi:hypothetical protein
MRIVMAGAADGAPVGSAGHRQGLPEVMCVARPAPVPGAGRQTFKLSWDSKAGGLLAAD